MLHFSCDLCGKHLDDRRFVVKLEVYPAFDPEEFDEGDLDADHLQEISELLNEMDTSDELPIEDCGPKTFRYDLCPECQRRYLNDPLGRDQLRRLNFSEN